MQDKLITLPEAARRVQPGQTLALGGVLRYIDSCNGNHFDEYVSQLLAPACEDTSWAKKQNYAKVTWTALLTDGP